MSQNVTIVQTIEYRQLIVQRIVQGVGVKQVVVVAVLLTPRQQI